VTATANDMVSIPRAELDALRAENRRLRREAGDAEALRRIRSDSREGRTFTREELAEAWGISEWPGPPLPDRVWDELEGLPRPFRNAAQRAIFHLIDEPVPSLADPFPECIVAGCSGSAQRCLVGTIGAVAAVLEQGCGPLPGEVGRCCVQAPAMLLAVGAVADQVNSEDEGAGGLGEDRAAAVCIVHLAQRGSAGLDAGDETLCYIHPSARCNCVFRVISSMVPLADREVVCHRQARKRELLSGAAAGHALAAYAARTVTAQAHHAQSRTRVRTPPELDGRLAMSSTGWHVTGR
jgi:hypothetical protein